MSRKVTAAAGAIGLPLDQVDVDVVPTIVSADGHTFTPRLTFVLTPTQLRLASDHPPLQFRDTSGSVRGAATANTLRIAGRNLTWASLRVVPACAGGVGGGVLVLALLSRRRRTAAEAAVIVRRYRSLIVDVEPTTCPAGRPVVDVTDFAALARLAERSGALVLHWTRGHVHTFVVNDDGVTYRHRVEDTAPHLRSLRPATQTAPSTDRDPAHAPGHAASQV
jgi:hypothetical protein